MLVEKRVERERGEEMEVKGRGGSQRGTLDGGCNESMQERITACTMRDAEELVIGNGEWEDHKGYAPLSGTLLKHYGGWRGARNASADLFLL